MNDSLEKSLRPSSLKLFSPAKLNLFFRILAKRLDGFHEIASLFQAIDLFDSISIERAKRDAFSSNEHSLEKDPSNTVLKALCLFRKKSCSSLFFKIHLEKKIPIQSGLGGGSSNAATTLWGLNELCGKPLKAAELLSLGAEIGSDVSFFFSLGSAYCTGRGEKVQKVEIPAISGWVAAPSFGMMTKEVYKAVDLTLLSKENPKNFLKSFYKDTPKFYNDLENAAFSLKPSLRRVKEELLEMGFDPVVMTGSGSCFFCQGKKSLPTSESMAFYPIASCQREENGWYGGLVKR
jgi:4-diphosphocytidyl-2-C-methyl-D-erythritol kinase